MATNNTACDDDPVSLVCKICGKTYQYKDGPLMLPCLHSFCKPCLAEHIKKEPTDGNKMACPTCKDRFPLPKDISQFPVNLRLSNLAKTATYKKQAEGGKVKCQKCRNTTPKDATTFSCSRYMFLCDDCKSNYQYYIDDENEKFIDLATCKEGEFKVHSPPPECPQHKKQELALFCNNCETLICPLCSLTEHQDHKKSSMNKIAEKARKELQKLTNGIDAALNTMDQTLQQIEDMKDKVKVSAKEATDRIDKAFDELIQAVENRREVLKRKCWEIAEEKDDVLSNQIVEVRSLRNNLGFVYLQATDAINNHGDNPEEILTVKKPIKVRMKRIKEAYGRQSMELREDDSINTSVEIRPLVEEILKAGSFLSVPDPSKCYNNGMAVPVAGLGKEKKLAIVLMDEAEKPVKGKRHFQYQLRKVGEDPDEYIPPKVTVTQSNNNDGTATLGFTPDQAGEYELTIMVRNRPIANPYKITARQSRDYSSFQNMQVTYKNVGGNCHGVAVHDNGTVYATNYSGHTIKVFKPDGTESVIGSSDNDGGQLSSPRGIALIDGTLYVVSHGNHMVKMYSTDGRFIGWFGGIGNENGQFKYPLGICTDGKGRVLVADQNNKRIQNFTSEGNFIKSFQCSTNPYDVAVDPVGNIHVVLYSNNDIAVYSEDGRQIETYNLGGKLRYPTGIYIDGEGNRLIGTGNGEVHIADPTGTLIATRQVNGDAVTMNKNGLIYATEYSSNRVLVYY